MKKTSLLPLSVRKSPTIQSTIKTLQPINSNEKEKRVEVIRVDLPEEDFSTLMNLSKDTKNEISNPVTPPSNRNPSGSSEKTVSLTNLIGKSKTITSPKSSPTSEEKSDNLKSSFGFTSFKEEIDSFSNHQTVQNNQINTPTLLTPSKELVVPLINIPPRVYSQPLQRIEIDESRDSPPPPLPPDSPVSFGMISPITTSSNPFSLSPIISPKTTQILSRNSFNNFSPKRAKTPKRNLVELTNRENPNPVLKIEKTSTLFDQNNEESYEWKILCSNIVSWKGTLKEIALKKCGLEDGKHLFSFFESLIENDVKLEVLDLDGNKMSTESCFYLGEYLFMSRDTLKVLNLRNNPLTDEGIWNIVQSYKELSERTWSFSQLTEIDISGTLMSDEGLLCLAIFAKDFIPNLNTLKCFGNYITNINAIKDLVKDGENLRHVDFWKNNIQVESLARFVTSSTNLVSLNLGCNLIGDKGIVIISKYLSFSKNLRCLDISGNEIRDSGGFHLANGILVNCGLTLLNLGKNWLTEMSVSRIIDCVKNHPTLCNLIISRNRIDPSRITDLNRYISDVNAVRKRIGYPVCKTFISSCIEISSPGKYLPQTQTIISNDSSFDEELTSHNTPRTITPIFEMVPGQSQQQISAKAAHKSNIPPSKLSLTLQQEVETIQKTLKTLKQNREEKLNEQALYQPKTEDSDIESVSQRDLSSYTSKTSIDTKANRSKFFISLLFYPSSINMIQEKEDIFYIKFFTTQMIIKRQRKLFKKTKTIATVEVSEAKIEQSTQSNSIFTLSVKGDSYGVKILGGREQEFFFFFLQHQEMSRFNNNSHTEDLEETISNNDLKKSKKIKEFQSPTGKMSALQKVSSVASILRKKKK